MTIDINEQETPEYAAYLLSDEYAWLQQRDINRDNKTYLASTDWYVIREADTGEAMPADVKTKRAEARTSIIEA